MQLFLIRPSRFSVCTVRKYFRPVWTTGLRELMQHQNEGSELARPMVDDHPSSGSIPSAAGNAGGEFRRAPRLKWIYSRDLRRVLLWIGAQIDVTHVWQTLENFGSELVKICQNLKNLTEWRANFRTGVFRSTIRTVHNPVKFCQFFSGACQIFTGASYFFPDVVKFKF